LESVRKEGKEKRKGKSGGEKARKVTESAETGSWKLEAEVGRET
jgi:hypothetical protein